MSNDPNRVTAADEAWPSIVSLDPTPSQTVMVTLDAMEPEQLLNGVTPTDVWLRVEGPADGMGSVPVTVAGNYQAVAQFIELNWGEDLLAEIAPALGLQAAGRKLCSVCDADLDGNDPHPSYCWFVQGSGRRPSRFR